MNAHVAVLSLSPFLLFELHFQRIAEDKGANSHDGRISGRIRSCFWDAALIFDDPLHDTQPIVGFDFSCEDADSRTPSRPFRALRCRGPSIRRVLQSGTKVLNLSPPGVTSSSTLQPDKP